VQITGVKWSGDRLRRPWPGTDFLALWAGGARLLPLAIVDGPNLVSSRAARRRDPLAADAQPVAGRLVRPSRPIRLSPFN